MKGPEVLINQGVIKIREDIVWSVLSSFIFAISGTILIKLWQDGVIKLYGGDYPIFLKLIVLLFIHDTYFYWTHRLIHHPKVFKAFHLVHHQSRIPTAWTAFSFHPYESLIQAAFLPLALYFVPVHWITFVLFISIMTLLGVLNHLGQEVHPQIRYFISAPHHQQHHQKMNYNYGLYFTFWDLLMKTELKASHDQ